MTSGQRTVRPSPSSDSERRLPNGPPASDGMFIILRILTLTIIRELFTENRSRLYIGLWSNIEKVLRVTDPSDEPLVGAAMARGIRATPVRWFLWAEMGEGGAQ